jgi:hypothetical protein
MAEKDRNTVYHQFLKALALFIILPILLVVPSALVFHFSLMDQIDASTINGLLTATAIVFGFASFEASEIEVLKAKYVLITTMAFFLMVTSEFYYLSVMTLGHVVKFVLLVAMANLFFNVFVTALAIWARAELKD